MNKYLLLAHMIFAFFCVKSQDTIQTLNANDTIIELTADTNNAQLVEKAKIDVSQNYTFYKVASTSTLVGTIFNPFAGLGIAIGTSSTTPKKPNLQYPDKELFNNPIYRDTYIQEAKRIKQNKVWNNFAIPTICYVMVGVLLVASYSNN